ncbi:ATP synthase subunit alpha [Puccinia sorghi]|uniref:ATP synthase subunit alpha n=1 Tax=Puccinia sorghi TaxID=27349 RepID=A0A0L6UM14_9BASI|nr:ATP synthase subunit alpha [Puccinia sorghi]
MVIITFALDTILNQKQWSDGTNKSQKLHCVNFPVVQKRSTVPQIVQTLEENNALKYSIILSKTASKGSPLQKLPPFSGCAGEWFHENEKHASIIYNDLSKQAVAYRQISLLLCHPLGYYCLKNLIQRCYQGFKFELRRSAMHSKVNLLPKKQHQVKIQAPL